jgi:hypothetical protein
MLHTQVSFGTYNMCVEVSIILMSIYFYMHFPCFTS